MALKKPSKSVYKVYVKTVDKYYSSGTSKATWNSLGWALSAASDAKYRHNCRTEDIEIHEFPVTDAIKHSYKELKAQELIKNAEEKEKKEFLKKSKEEKLEIERAKNVIQTAQETLAKTIDFLKSKGIEVNIENTESSI
jgi:hypothetical protein